MITRNGKPAVRLAPVRKKEGLIALKGKYRGQIWMADECGEDLQRMFGFIVEAAARHPHGDLVG